MHPLVWILLSLFVPCLIAVPLLGGWKVREVAAWRVAAGSVARACVVPLLLFGCAGMLITGIRNAKAPGKVDIGDAPMVGLVSNDWFRTPPAGVQTVQVADGMYAARARSTFALFSRNLTLIDTGDGWRECRPNVSPGQTQRRFQRNLRGPAGAGDPQPAPARTDAERHEPRPACGRPQTRMETGD